MRTHEEASTPLENVGRMSGRGGCAEFASSKAGPGGLPIWDAQEGMLLWAGWRAEGRENCPEKSWGLSEGNMEGTVCSIVETVDGSVILFGAFIHEGFRAFLVMT
jgi:hypothetical protein